MRKIAFFLSAAVAGIVTSFMVASPASAAINDGVRNDVVGDGVSDVAAVLWDTVIEHAPTVLGLLATVYVFFLGYRLLMLLISKTNGAFQGLMRRA